MAATTTTTNSGSSALPLLEDGRRSTLGAETKSTGSSSDSDDSGKGPGGRRNKVRIVPADRIRQSLHDLGGSFMGGGIRTVAAKRGAAKPEEKESNRENSTDVLGGGDVYFPQEDKAKKAELRRLFEKYDRDMSGCIDEQEVLRMFADLGVTLRRKALQKTLSEIDTDGNGLLDFHEFVQMFEIITADVEDVDQSMTVTEQLRLGIEMINKSGDFVDKIKEQKKAFQRNIHAADRQIANRARIRELLYGMKSWAPDYMYRRWWDVVVLLLIVYCIVVPTSTIVMQSDPSPAQVALDLLLSIGLFTDIYVNLRTAVRPSSLSFALDVEPKQILRHYARRGLFFDVVSALPVDCFCNLIGTSVMTWRVTRLLRVTKIFKYPQLFRMTNRGNMDPEYVNFYFWTVPVLQGCFKLTITLHTLTLGRVLVSPGGWPSERADCAEYGLDPCAGSAVGQYSYAAFWLWALLTTQGQAALEDANVYVYAAFVLVLSLLLQGYVVADMSALVIKSNVTEQINDSMRSTLAIMEHYTIPQTLQQEVLSFQYHSLQQNAAAGLAHTLQRLPAQMQREVGLYVKVDLVTNVPMFRELSSDCRLAVANCLQQSFAEPQDFIIRFGAEGNEMFFMMHGFADVIAPASSDFGAVFDPDQGTIVATIRRGDYFGEVALLITDQKRTASVQALTYCDLFRLHQADFSQLYSQFDELQHRMTAEARRRELVAMASADEDACVDGARRESRAVGVKGQLIYARQRKSILGGDEMLEAAPRRRSVAPHGPVQRVSTMRTLRRASTAAGMLQIGSVSTATGGVLHVNSHAATSSSAGATAEKDAVNVSATSFDITPEDESDEDDDEDSGSAALQALKQLEQKMYSAIDRREERMDLLVADETRALTQRLDRLERFVRDSLAGLDDELRKGERGFAGLFGHGHHGLDAAATAKHWGQQQLN